MLLDYIDLPTPYRVDHINISPNLIKPLHQHPNAWELVVVVRGAGTRTVNAQTSPFTTGDATLLPPGTPHRWMFSSSETDAHGRIRALGVFIRNDWLHAVAGLTPMLWKTLEPLFQAHDSITLGGRDRARLNALVRRAGDEVEELRALRLIEAVHLFACAVGAQHIRGHQPRTRDEEVRDNLRAYIGQNYMRTVTLADAAREIGTSRSTFCVRFKQLLGTTFVDYVNGVRIQRACSLLSRTPLSITEVANAVGFSDLAYFNRQFRRRMDMSPTEWRKGGHKK